MRRALHLLVALAAVLALGVLAGCGEKQETLGDTSVLYLPGVKPTSPPWRPEYAHLKTRIRRLRLPPIGKQQVHHHALVHIYNDGLLIPVQPNIGLYPPQKAFSSVHTHDSSGVVHMESVRPFNFTLGDFFAIWGVPFGQKTLGNLKASGNKQIHVYVNGKPLAHPVGYVMRDQDNISIGYGSDSSFPHKPDTGALKAVDKGKLGCGQTEKGKPVRSCIRGTGK